MSFRPLAGALRSWLGVPPGVAPSLLCVNWLFQRLLRIDADCPYGKNFTSRVLHGRRLSIEDDCPTVRRALAVSGGAYINAYDGIRIGRGTIWAPNVAIVAQDHDRDDLAATPDNPPIVIGRDCWLGFGAILMPGVTIGDRCIVGANAVVNRSFPESDLVIAGAPARVIRRRGDDDRGNGE